MPKNSVSPHKNKVIDHKIRGRSRSNDQSSHNVKSALDHSTLEILKSMSNKKQKERSTSQNNQNINKENIENRQFTKNQIKSNENNISNYIDTS